MKYKIYVAKYGMPQSGAVLNWDYLAAMDGTDKSGAGPAFTEVSAANAKGWYYFEVTYGTTPFDVNELVGVIDCDNDAALGLNDIDRFHPVIITLRDLAFARLTNKAVQTKLTGDVIIFDDDGSTGQLKVDFTDGDTTITVEPASP